MDRRPSRSSDTQPCEWCHGFFIHSWSSLARPCVSAAVDSRGRRRRRRRKVRVRRRRRRNCWSCFVSFFFLSRRDGSAPNGRRIGHIWAGQSPTTEDGPLTFEIHPLVSRRHEEALLQDRDPHRPGPEGVQGRLVRPEPGRQGLSSGKAALGHCRGHHCRRFVLLFLCLSSNSTRTTFS